MTVIRKLAQTCNFCNCLNDLLIRDRFVLGIRYETIRKKLLQEKKLTLSHAVDMGRSGETTNLRLKELKKTLGTEEEVNTLRQNNKKWNQQQRKFGDTRRGPCKYCGSDHQQGACPAYGQRCNNCGRQHRFAKVCLQKKALVSERTYTAYTPTQLKRRPWRICSHSRLTSPARRSFNHQK